MTHDMIEQEDLESEHVKMYTLIEYFMCMRICAVCVCVVCHVYSDYHIPNG